MASPVINFILISFFITTTICYGVRLDRQSVKNHQHGTMVVKQHKSITYGPNIVENHSNVKTQQDVGTNTAQKGNGALHRSNPHLEWTFAHGLEFAGLVIKTPCKTISASIRIDKPKVAPGHRSGAYISIESGSGTNFNQIQVGWIVHPDMYGDFEVHLYARWTGDNDKKCFHLHCSGFVTTNRTGLTLGSVLIPSADDDDPINRLRLSLSMDHAGTWFLSGGENDLGTIGYWDVSYFSSLSSQGATTTRIGGEVFTPEGSDFSPPMGLGQLVNGDPYDSCFFDGIQLDSKDPVRSDTQGVWTRCYETSDAFDHKVRVPNGFGFFFGGVGGNKLECPVIAQ